MNNYLLNVKGEEVLLNKELVNISDDFMKSYKSDIEMDIEMLLDKNKLTNDFIWVVRESGTHLYEKNKLFILEDGSRDDYLYFKDYKVKVFEINVTKRGRKNVYGTLKKLSRKELTDKVLNNGKSYNNIHFKVVMNDNNTYEVDLESKDITIYALADKIKVKVDDIKKVYRQRYFN